MPKWYEWEKDVNDTVEKRVVFTTRLMKDKAERKRAIHLAAYQRRWRKLHPEQEEKSSSCINRRDSKAWSNAVDSKSISLAGFVSSNLALSICAGIGSSKPEGLKNLSRRSLRVQVSLLASY